MRRLLAGLASALVVLGLLTFGPPVGRRARPGGRAGMVVQQLAGAGPLERPARTATASPSR